MQFLHPKKPLDDIKNLFNAKKKNPLLPLNPKQLSTALTTKKAGGGGRKSLLFDG